MPDEQRKPKTWEELTYGRMSEEDKARAREIYENTGLLPMGVVNRRLPFDKEMRDKLNPIISEYNIPATLLLELIDWVQDRLGLCRGETTKASFADEIRETAKLSEMHFSYRCGCVIENGETIRMCEETKDLSHNEHMEHIMDMEDERLSQAYLALLEEWR